MYIIFWIILLIVVIIITVKVMDNREKERIQSIESTKDSLVKAGFVVSKEVTDTENNYSLLIDDTNHKWAVISAYWGKSFVYNYSDLIEYEILEDEDSIVKGRVGSAIIGGLLFGGVGAVVGATRSKKVKTTCKSMSINITANKLEQPRVVISLINKETKTDSVLYKIASQTAQSFSSLLSFIKSKAEQEKHIELVPDNKMQLSTSDEIERYYSLMEKGIISEDEFEQKKKQLLGL